MRGVLGYWWVALCQGLWKLSQHFAGKSVQAFVVLVVVVVVVVANSLYIMCRIH